MEVTFAEEEPALPPTGAVLHYRHVNQADVYECAAMQPSAGGFAASIPAAYTDSPYPLMYFFELRRGQADAWFHPGLDIERLGQPYFVVRQEGY